MRHFLAPLLLFALLGSPLGGLTEELAHPIIKPVAGSLLLEERSFREDFGSLSVNYQGDKGNLKTAEGIYWRLNYVLAGMSRDEIKANFTQAVLAIGGEAYGLDRATRANFRIGRRDGGNTWLKLALKSNGAYELEIVDEAALELAVEFDAEGLTRQLLELGRVSVYGILFATDSDRLLPGSGSVLDIVSEALLLRPDLEVEVQGHTDATGTVERNDQLSGARATSVKRALELFGVSPERMRAKGYGARMPVADNATPEGRQLNRRVDFALPGYETSLPVVTSQAQPFLPGRGDTSVSQEPSPESQGATVSPPDAVEVQSNGGDDSTAGEPNPVSGYAEDKGRRAVETATQAADEKVNRAIDRTVEGLIDDIIDPS